MEESKFEKSLKSDKLNFAYAKFKNSKKAKKTAAAFLKDYKDGITVLVTKAWTFFLDIPTVKGPDSGKDIDIIPWQDTVTFYRQPRDSKSYSTTIFFHKIVIAHPNEIVFACHGRFTLLQAAFLNYKIGGDIVCGGGIKTIKLPRRKERDESKALKTFIDTLGESWQEISVMRCTPEAKSLGAMYVSGQVKQGYLAKLFIGTPEALELHAKQEGVTFQDLKIQVI